MLPQFVQKKRSDSSKVTQLAGLEVGFKIQSPQHDGDGEQISECQGVRDAVGREWV